MLVVSFLIRQYCHAPQQPLRHWSDGSTLVWRVDTVLPLQETRGKTDLPSMTRCPHIKATKLCCSLVQFRDAGGMLCCWRRELGFDCSGRQPSLCPWPIKHSFMMFFRRNSHNLPTAQCSREAVSCNFFNIAYNQYDCCQTKDQKQWRCLIYFNDRVHCSV